MRTRQKYLAIALTATFAVAVAGCTADDAAKTPSESPTAAPFGGTPPAQGARAEDSPLQQFLDAGVDVSNGEELQAQAKKNQETIQALIAQCMADEGFEYIHWDPSAQFLNSIDRSDFKVDDKAWVSKFGYGIVNTPKGDRAQAPSTQDADPNLAYVATLEVAAQKAYYEVLYGTTQEDLDEMYDEESQEAEPYNWEENGCSGAAQQEVSGEWDDLSVQYDDLFNAIYALDEQLETTPAVIKLNEQWSSCMADAGFSFATQPEAEKSINDALFALYAEISEDEFAADGFKTYEGPQFDELAVQEIMTAEADRTCRESTDYRDSKTRAKYELEKQFVEDNKTELEQYKAAVEQIDKD